MMKMMSNLFQKAKQKVNADSLKRLIGSVEGSDEGPAVIALAGMHGNEQAGVVALQQVFEVIEAKKPTFKGSLWGVRANLSALERQVRFIDEDMNRLWFPSIIRNIEKTPEEELESSERREMKRLLPLLERLIPEASGEPVIIADLHSFSSEGCLFTITADNEKSIRLLSHLYAPMVFGIEHVLRGTTLRYFQDLGHLTFAFEGGQHEDELAVYNIKAAMFVLLRQIGCLRADAAPGITEFEQHLAEYTRNVPTRVELVYQHILDPEDGFEMRPGYKNFDRITKGEWLATDRRGKIYARCSGFILMPLYQAKGDDGFFIVREQHS